ncbi:hypothetical protein DY120_07500 [Apilactobacillus micheneri]|uniref:Uncharacterized protein n=1 Tax=Apilactobacillus micheneri TaxID=1899430 RepID=A0ABY2YWA3_9LACO|nr:hypothetical protein [Apilactobacillus micheneri]TPR22832.1 hypothetical protein DY114_07485 [Apilactobacillus micheneri]TPR24404.1 hypothetical protein DY111_07500 [Apilactobacillus micheneri]TPR27282.1 hypothetical protein DY113_07280 [Apilactobacillus micheneri]TPR28664.1 hypothetical protein DY127_07260 [Apilactobacillus micheneri]TPR28724.1 hypothetical protein DY117_07260 [Apilactobacillus micheneri]
MQKNINKNNNSQNSAFKCRVVSKLFKGFFRHGYWNKFVLPTISAIEQLIIITEKLPHAWSILKNIIRIIFKIVIKFFE